jgi:hypothetical protein
VSTTEISRYGDPGTLWAGLASPPRLLFPRQIVRKPSHTNWRNILRVVPVLPESTRRYCKRQFFWTNWTVRTEVVQKAERSSRKYIADRRHKIEDRRPKDRLKLQLYPHLWSTSLPFETQVISTPLIHVIIAWNPSHIHTSDPRHYRLKLKSVSILQIHVIIVWNPSHNHTSDPRHYRWKLQSFNHTPDPHHYRLKLQSYPHLWFTSLSFETQVISIPLIHVIIVWNPRHIHTSDPRHYRSKL